MSKITTIAEAQKLMQKGIDAAHPGLAKDLQNIVSNRLKDKPDFSKNRFTSVLLEDGKTITTQIKEFYSGTPEFRYGHDGNEEDSTWEYARTGYKVIGGVDPNKTVEQALWFKKSGRAGVGKNSPAVWNKFYEERK